jgi:malonate transporter MadL subunit
MVIFGTALLAGCYLAGVFIGELLAILIGVQANVGGVGIAMMLLIAAQHYLRKRGLLAAETEKGITFWAMLYIPVVVAMAATQNVVVAIKGGPIALLSAAGAFALCVLVISAINRIIHRAHIAGEPLPPVDLADEEVLISPDGVAATHSK